MKKSLPCVIGMCLVSTMAFAQTYTPGNPVTSSLTTETNSTSSREAGQSQKFTRSKDLVGATIKDTAGQKLGSIDEIMINPQTGESLAYVDISGGRYAFVPMQAFSVSRPAGAVRNAELTLNTTKDALQSGPTVAKHEWQKLDDPTFVQSIYSHYHVQAPSAMGGTGSDATGGSSGGQGSTQKPPQSQ